MRATLIFATVVAKNLACETNNDLTKEETSTRGILILLGGILACI